MDFLMKGFMPNGDSRRDEGLIRLIHRSRAECQSQSASQPAIDDLEQVCGRVISRNLVVKNGESHRSGTAYGLLPFSDDVVVTVAIVCVSLGKLHLLETAVAALKGEMPRPKFVELAAEFHRFSFDQLREA